MVNVKSIAEMGAYVHLQEYKNQEGMILLSELSRRRIRSINKLIRVGRNECVVVIRVDQNKGYIDLSKRRVSPEEVLKCEEKFAKAKCVNSILRHVAELLNYETDEQLEDLYKKTAWLFDKKQNRPGAAYEVFQRAVSDPTILEECDLDENTKSVLLENIRRRLTPQAVKIRADIEVGCYKYEGIDAVKAALTCGLKKSSEDCQIKINLLTPPQYVVTTSTLERQLGLTRVQEAIDEIKKEIEARGGVFNVQIPPKVVSHMEELELAREMEKLEEANRDIDGDDDADSDDDDGSESEGDGDKS